MAEEADTTGRMDEMDAAKVTFAELSDLRATHGAELFDEMMTLTVSQCLEPVVVAEQGDDA